jgi:hypothetical protein
VEVTALDVSPVGHLVAATVADYTIGESSARIWDIETGQEAIRTQRRGWVEDGTWSPDGNLLAIATSIDTDADGRWDQGRGRRRPVRRRGRLLPDEARRCRSARSPSRRTASGSSGHDPPSGVGDLLRAGGDLGLEERAGRAPHRHGTVRSGAEPPRRPARVHAVHRVHRLTGRRGLGLGHRSAPADPPPERHRVRGRLQPGRFPPRDSQRGRDGVGLGPPRRRTGAARPEGPTAARSAPSPSARTAPGSPPRAPTAPIRVWALDLDELVGVATRGLTRDLTDDECRQYLHTEGCPETEWRGTTSSPPPLFRAIAAGQDHQPSWSSNHTVW